MRAAAVRAPLREVRSRLLESNAEAHRPVRAGGFWISPTVGFVKAPLQAGTTTGDR